MRRITLLVCLLLAVAATPALAHVRHHRCQTHSCFTRVAKRNHKRTIHKWKAETSPYRGWLYSTRMCESHDVYSINTGNGFYGAYQFTIPSWERVGGQGLPNKAEPLEQDVRATRLLKLSGAGNWPVCG